MPAELGLSQWVGGEWTVWPWVCDSARQVGNHTAMKNATYCCLSSCVLPGCLPPAENVANTLANTFRRTVRPEQRPLRHAETIPHKRACPSLHRRRKLQLECQAAEFF